MAIKNFMQSGSYTRISQINWVKGRILDVEIEVFSEEPDNPYVYVEEYDALQEDGSKVTAKRTIDGNPTPLAVMMIPVTDVQFGDHNVTSYETHFKQSLWSGVSDANLHSLVYDYLLTLDMFDGTTSD